MLAVFALVAAIGSAAGDDGRQRIPEGSRVRVLSAEDPAARSATHGSGPLVGRVVSVQRDSVTVETSRGGVIMPFKNMSRLQVSHRSRNLKRGALIGGLVGFAVVTTLFVAAFDAEDDYAISTGNSVAIGALIGAPAGGLIGLGIGALASPWHDVPLPRAAMSRRVTVTLRIGF